MRDSPPRCASVSIARNRVVIRVREADSDTGNGVDKDRENRPRSFDIRIALSPRSRQLVAEPGAGIFNNFQREFLFVDGVGFVAGAEVEDLALADFPEAAAAEVFAFVPFLFEDDG